MLVKTTTVVCGSLRSGLYRPGNVSDPFGIAIEYSFSSPPSRYLWLAWLDLSVHTSRNPELHHQTTITYIRTNDIDGVRIQLEQIGNPESSTIHRRWKHSTCGYSAVLQAPIDISRLVVKLGFIAVISQGRENAFAKRKEESGNGGEKRAKQRRMYPDFHLVPEEDRGIC